jgi:hypothetical protein
MNIIESECLRVPVLAESESTWLTMFTQKLVIFGRTHNKFSTRQKNEKIQHHLS